MEITKAIITAGGRGTRFLPVSSAYQKEMVPVMNKPQLQWVIEEAIQSGIKEIAVVSREGINTFADYLKDDNEFWGFLKQTGKESLMDSWLTMKSQVEFTLFEQKETDPYGNGTPFIITKDWAGGEAVIAMWGDDLLVHSDKSKPTCISQMMRYYNEFSPVAVMSVIEVPRDEIKRYGSYEYFDDEEKVVPYQAKSLVEKPSPQEAPSLYANASRFVLTTDVFEELSNRVEGKGGELWLTDAVNRLMQKGKVVIAAPWEGSLWMPCGDPLRWLKANILTAMHSDEYQDEKSDLINFMSDLV